MSLRRLLTVFSLGLALLGSVGAFASPTCHRPETVKTVCCSSKEPVVALLCCCLDKAEEMPESCECIAAPDGKQAAPAVLSATQPNLKLFIVAGTPPAFEFEPYLVEAEPVVSFDVRGPPKPPERLSPPDRAPPVSPVP